MLLCKKILNHKHFGLNALVLLGIVLVGGCGFKPLYGFKSGDEPIQDKLASIEVVADKVIQTELIFLLETGNEKPISKYRLDVSITESGFPRLIGSPVENPIPHTLTITGKFSLTEIQSKQVIFSGTAFSHASYFLYSQRFANLYAHRDAVRRAKKELARTLHLRLSAYFEKLGSFEPRKSS